MSQLQMLGQTSTMILVSKDEYVEQLRSENARLKARIQELKDYMRKKSSELELEVGNLKEDLKFLKNMVRLCFDQK
jgi:hypothetical protein